jgi:hypothetical protein
MVAVLREVPCLRLLRLLRLSDVLLLGLDAISI